MLPIEVDSEIKLIPVHESLSENLFDLVDIDRDYLSQWLPFPPSTTKVQDMTNFINKSLTLESEGKSLVCAIEYRGHLVGIISFNNINQALKKTDIGYWIASKNQGQGIVFKSCAKMIDYAFNELKLEKVEIRAAKNNTASRKVCETLGLKLEGTITHAENLHGNILDMAIYGTHAN